MSGPDIFISYSREDRAAARHFAECFAQEGFSVWWDAALHSGETFDEVIERELKAAKAVVVLWSPRSVTSRWVRAEATLADRMNKFAPVIIEACDRPLIFELTHTVDLADWPGDTSDARWKIFVRDLHRVVERNSGAAVKEEPKQAGSRPGDRSNGYRPVAPQRDRSNGPAFASQQSPFEPARSRANRTEPDDSQATQFYTRTDGYDLLGADQFHCLEMSDERNRLEKRFVVSPLGLKIGRSAPADVILADPRVSRTHCVVELADDALKVSDLNSTNGTYIDGERISGTAMLQVGSLLRVGNVSFKHEIRTRADV